MFRCQFLSSAVLQNRYLRRIVGIEIGLQISNKYAIYFNDFQICVNKCPEDTWYVHDVLPRNSKPNGYEWQLIRDKLICNDSSVASTVTSLETLEKVIKEERCASYYIRSTSGTYAALPSIPNFKHYNVTKYRNFPPIEKSFLWR